MLKNVMKLWFKYLLGIVLGSILFFVIPSSAFSDGSTLELVVEISIRLGSLFLTVLYFFSIPLSVYELFEKREFWKFGSKNLGLFLVSIIAMTILGLAFALLVMPVRIPLLADTASQPISGVSSLLLKIIPSNILDVFLNSGEYLLPLVLLSLVLGLAFSHDPLMVRPLMSLFDAISRTMYLINTFMTEILGVLLIPITLNSLHVIKTSLDSNVFGTFYFILLAEVVIFVFLILPLVYFLGSGKKNPFPILYALSAPALAALASGNLRFTIGTLIKHVKENLGVKRRYNDISIPAGVFIGRAGTAFITATTFVAILSSYSQISLSPLNLLLIAILVPCVTLISSAVPQQGPIIGITLLCSFFGKGFENGYLTMIPLALPLSMVANLMDVLWIGMVNALLAEKQNTRDRRSAKNFI
jgi:Na+/H+-dicarboxylate symporter